MFRNPLSVGIDIGSHSIKAVVVQQKKEQLELAAFAEIVLSTPAVNDQHSVNSTVLLSAMRKLKKHLPRAAKRVVLALPDSAVISKIVQLDTSLSDDETEFAISQALGASSPFPLDELWLDFYPLNHSDRFQDIGSTVPFQIFAARRDTISARLEVAKKAGFKTQVMELQTNGLLWLAEHLTEMSGLQEQWGMIDIGKRHTEFCVKPAMGGVYRREIAFGARHAKHLDKNTPTLLLADEEETFTRQLIEHLKRQIQLYNSTQPRSPLQGVWLCGGSQALVIEQMLQDALKIQVEWVQPFSYLPVGKEVEHLPSTVMTSQYAVAMGLALRGFEA
ncbi:TPA: type IV pilus biogenesis protein PilM [Photobacterium damselae]